MFEIITAACFVSVNVCLWYQNKVNKIHFEMIDKLILNTIELNKDIARLDKEKTK